MVTALLPDALFYSEYAMTDAIFPVLVLGWLLTVHGWLTATSPQARYAAAVGSALLAGYAYTVHSRGLVMVAVYVAAAAVFNPATQSPPADASVVETAWPAGEPAQASWPRAPAGWRVVTSDRTAGWVAWRKG